MAGNLKRNSEVVHKKTRIEHLEKIIGDLEKAERAEEDAFIRERAPEFASLADIESEEDFNRLLAEFAALPKVVEIGAKINATKAEKRAIEDELIERAIALASANIVADLRKGTHRVNFRKKIIDAYLAYAD
jgi:hypothetical protein